MQYEEPRPVRPRLFAFYTGRAVQQRAGPVQRQPRGGGQVRVRPFSEPQGASGSTSQPLRFAARELDATAGLYYVRARWYDAGMGRFISEDPIGLAGGINNYAYAANDPVNLGDPMGLCYGRMAVFILGEGEPCPRRMGLEFLIDRWSGTRNGDGAASMSGVVYAASAGWQDERYDRCEVASILSDYISALSSNPGRFASKDYPAEFDFKYAEGAGHARYQVGNQWLRADEFGNFAAGYAGQHAFNGFGHMAMRAGGIYFAMEQKANGERTSGEHWSDRESSPMINAGAARARREQVSNGGMSYTRDYGARRRPYVAPLTSKRGCG
jgi:RHS repeat-associated protein